MADDSQLAYGTSFRFPGSLGRSHLLAIHRKNGLKPPTFWDCSPNLPERHHRPCRLQLNVPDLLQPQRGLLMAPRLSSHERYACIEPTCSRHHGVVRAEHQHHHVWQKLKEAVLDHTYFLRHLHRWTGKITAEVAYVYSDEAVQEGRVGCTGPPTGRSLHPFPTPAPSPHLRA
jgi:hypothetical protein